MQCAASSNAFVERFIGSARRECFDHVIVFNESGLQRLMSLYCSYYERSARICRWTKTRRFLVRSPRPAMAPSWRFRRLVAFIIDTNGARPERPADGQARSSCYENTPGVRSLTKVATVANTQIVAVFQPAQGRRAQRRQRRPTGKQIDGARDSVRGAHVLIGDSLTFW